MFHCIALAPTPIMKTGESHFSASRYRHLPDGFRTRGPETSDSAADPVDVSAAIDHESIARTKFRSRFVSVGEITASFSERNTTSLFGSGLIDAIPAVAIKAAAKEQANSTASPEIHGQVSILADGRIGRFGWKGQTASLEDFVLTACAAELGLEVPGHPQARDPLRPDKNAPGLDLSAQRVCRADVVRRRAPQTCRAGADHKGRDRGDGGRAPAV